MTHLRKRTARRLAALFAVLASGALAQGDAPPPAVVSVIEAEPRSIALSATLPGRVVASAEAEVRPQVAGIVTERLFREGGRVEAGDVLYTIDPATYDAAVAQAEAAVAEAQAQFGAADKEATRVQRLVDRTVASDQTLEAAVSARDVAAAAVKVAEAQLTSARIELDRTSIRARLSGEIGLSLTSRGALVAESQADPMAVIRNIDTVYVDVTQSAAEVLRWRRGHLGVEIAEAERTVALTLPDGVSYPETGLLTAAEPVVDPQTGVVVLRMEFPNPDHLLLPGMYVQVDVQTAVAEGVYLVPQQGVSRDRRGRPVAFVVGEGDVVEERQLDVLQAQGGDWIVRGGLSPGDRVIVAGVQKAAPGATVVPEPAPAEGEATTTEAADAPAGPAAAAAVTD